MFRIILLLAVFHICSNFQVSGSVIYVDQSALGSNDGSSWQNAFTDLQDALSVAGIWDQIWVAAGTYKPSSTNNRDESFTIPAHIELHGGFAGTELTLDERNWKENPTILSGAIGDNNDITDNSKRIVDIGHAGVLTVITGFHFRRAYSDPYGAEVHAALACYDGTLVVENCEFYQNTSASSSAAIIAYGAVTFRNCLFYNNTTNFGGTVSKTQLPAICNLEYCTFSDNMHYANFGKEFSSYIGSTDNVTNCIFWDNSGDNDLSVLISNVDNCIVEGGYGNGSNIINSDPGFQNPGNNDYRITPQSPAFNSAALDYTTSRDLAGNDRNQFGNPDIGCYEYSNSGILYVDGNATGSSDGSSWANAFVSLHDAIAAAQGGEEIWMRAGIYYNTNTAIREFSYYINKELHIRGSFAGWEWDPELREPIQFTTLLSGDIGVQNYLQDNTRSCFTINADGYNVVLENLYITEYYSEDLMLPFLNSTGAINCDGGIISLNECTLTGNFTENGGTVNVGNQENFTANSCSFISNEARFGGAISSDDTALQLSNCIFNNNKAIVTGGAIYFGNGGIDTTQAFVEDCIFTDNTAEYDSPAIFGLHGNITVTNSIFEGNSIMSPVFQGAVLRFNYTNLNINNCIFSENSGSDLIECWSGDEEMSVSIESSLFHHNILTDSWSAVLFHLRNYSSTDWNIINCTISNNFEGDYFSKKALYLDGSNFNIYNNIIYDEQDISAVALSPLALQNVEFIEVQSNILDDYYDENNFNFDPLFVNPASADFHLQSTSPAINAGDNSVLSALTDLDGNPRILNAQVDLGCYEAINCEVINDDCINATVLVLNSGPVFGETGCSDVQPADPQLPCAASTGKTLWYSFIAPDPGNVSVNVDFIEALGGNFNLSFAVYSGDCVSLTPLTCVNNFGAGISEFAELSDLTPGNEYFIRVQGNGGQDGVFSIRIQQLTCYVTDVQLMEQTSCYSYNNTYSQELIISHNIINISGDILVNGTVYELESSPQTIVMQNLTADGQPLDLSISFSDFPECSVTLNNFFLSPERCTPDDVIFVDTDAIGIADGSSWQDAYTNLHDAITAFTAGKEIWIAEGIYTPALNNRNVSFNLVDGMKIYGGFEAYENDANQRDLTAHVTVLSGAIGSLDANDNSKIVLNIGQNVTEILIDGLQISDGYNNDPEASGAGIRMNGSGKLKMQNIVVSDCSSRNGAAVSVNNGAEVIMRNCEFDSNLATQNGGAFLLDSVSVLQAVNCLFSNNQAEHGGVFYSGAEMKLEECVFEFNQANSDGGVLYAYSDSIVMGNSSISGNSAGSRGGFAYLENQSNLLAVACSFSSSEAGLRGGFCFADSSGVRICNSLINNSSAPEGALMSLVNGSDAELLHCNAVGNISEGLNPVFNSIFNNSESSIVLDNSILFNNQASQFIVGEIEANYCLMDFELEGNAIILGNPNFIGNSYYELDANSPAINQAQDLIDPCNYSDFLGQDRTVFGQADIGCFELQECTISNDSCATSINIPISADWTFGSNFCSGNEGNSNASCNGAQGNSVWYSFVAPEMESVRISISDLVAESPNFNPKLIVYSGDCSALLELACADDEGNLGEESLVIDGLIQNESYLICVLGAENQIGSFKIRAIEFETFSSCPADINNDGLVNAADLLAILSEFGCSLNCNADITGDGQVNSGDILSLLSAYGADC